MAGELTPEQRQAFDDRLRELGLDSSHVVPSLNTGDTPGSTYLSNDPAHDSAIPHQPITVNHIDDLKRLAGIPDADYESGAMQHHLEAPPEWPQEKNAHALEDLDPTERGHLRDALAAYVYGDSSRVSSYTTVLNNNFFPLQAGAFAVQNITIAPGNPLVISGNNVACNFGIVTIEAGGQIIVETDCTVTCQQMINE
jgi:hypothetical protein